MRMRTILILTIIQLVILLRANDEEQNNCLILDRNNSCSCCKSGYLPSGPTCSDVCQHCLTHNVPGGECTYYCETGYYGKTCDKECPDTCADGKNGPNHCEENNGLPVCVECFHGYYGKQCDQVCDTNCKSRKCRKADGRCLSCSSNEFYGDHCRLPCSQGCASGRCNRTGHCTDGCKFGFYGEQCQSQCGSNCQKGKCTSHGYHAYNCTEGCHGGYWGTPCLEKCPNHCTECEHQSGRCTLCVDNYNQKAETGECVKEGKPAVADGSNQIIIGIVVSVVIVVIFISGNIIMVIWKKRRPRHRVLADRYAEEHGSLSDSIRQPEQIPLLQQGSYQGWEGVRNSDLVDLQIRDIQETFIETSIYKLVEEKLKNNGHVTISGASGEGKTSMALMLGNDYKMKGYQLVFVTDPIKFNMEIVKGRKTLCIFDDIFGAGRFTDTSKLKEVLLFVELYLKQAKEMTQQMGDIPSYESSNRQEKEELNFMVIFTSKTYNLTSGMSKIPECKHFMNSNVVDVTAGDGYSQSDMEQIFMKHKQKHNINENMPVEQICNLKMLPFGFPLLCMMYFQLLYSKGIDVIQFFSEPISFLELEMKSIIESQNAKSASLILMMLCEDGFNVFHLEYESVDTVLNDRVKKVQNLIKSLNRADIAEAAKSFQGTYFTKGDTMYFSHPAITYACAFVIFDIYPTFLLRNGGIKFLYERIHPELSEVTMVDRKNNTILISPQNSDVIAERLAEDIKKGEYSMTISHPILQNRDVVDNLFKKMNSPSVYFHERYNQKCFLHWAVHAKSLYLIQRILKIEPNFFPEEIQEACQACATFGNTLILNFLFEHLASQITETVVINVALAVAYTGNSEMFECLPLNCQNPKLSLSFTSQGHNMLHAACIGGSKKIVERVSQWIDIDSQDQNGQTAIMLAVLAGKKEVVIFLDKNGANLTLRDKKGDTVFHLACQVGKRSTVEHLLPSFDINSRGRNGWTPVMIAAYNGKKEVVDLLVKKGADLTLTSNHGNTVLHLASLGGNASIVKQLLPLFEINSRGENDWTPVMIAAYSGKKEAFDLLVTKGADLTLTSNHGHTVLHIACQGGNTSIVEHLLSSIDINSRGKNGWTPVMNSAYSGKKEVFDLLVTKGADLTLTDNYGDNVLHLACREGNTSIVGQLLPLLDIESRGKNGWTPVMNAAYSGKKEVFYLLVTKGADLTLTVSDSDNILHQACKGGDIDIVRYTLSLYDVNVKGGNSFTPLMWAVCRGHIDVVDFLVSNNADVNLVDGDGDSLLHLACESGDLAVVKRMLPFADIDLRDKHGWTPLMYAILKGNENAFQYLVDEGASLDLVDNVGDDVLTLAYRGGCKKIIQQLTPCGEEIRRIEKWTDVMYYVAYGHRTVLKEIQQDSPKLLKRDGFGDTLLHLACRGGDLQCVEYLLPFYDINVRGRYGWTPVMMAARCGHMDVVQCLISHKADLSLVSDTGEDVLSLARRGTNTDIVTFMLTLQEFSDTG